MHLRVVLCHEGAHLGGRDRVTGNQVDSLVGTSDLESILDIDATLREEFSRGHLKHWDESLVEVRVPLRLVAKVEEDLLVGHFLAGEGPSGPLDKRA